MSVRSLLFILAYVAAAAISVLGFPWNMPVCALGAIAVGMLTAEWDYR